MKKLLVAVLLGTAVISCKSDKAPEVSQVIGDEKYIQFYGLWTGDFIPDFEGNVTDENQEDMQKKITIKIDRIVNGWVEGQSIVSGNQRPVKGTIDDKGYGKLQLSLDEPGTSNYDGHYELTLVNGAMNGDFRAYKAMPDATTHKTLTLVKKQFTYNPNLMLEDAVDLVDWYNPHMEMVKYNPEDYEDYEGEDEDSISGGEVAVAEPVKAADTALTAGAPTDEENEQMQEFLSEVYRTASEAVYNINASTTKLTEEELKELHKLDLEIIRNTIFARHGFSFKKNSIRRFFEVNSWYVPVANNVDKQLTKLEKENIALLVRMEKYAEDHYDYFGR